jgi:hypothetical protein
VLWLVLGLGLGYGVMRRDSLVLTNRKKVGMNDKGLDATKDCKYFLNFHILLAFVHFRGLLYCEKRAVQGQG